MYKTTIAGEHSVSEWNEFLQARSCQLWITFFHVINCQFWSKYWFV